MTTITLETIEINEVKVKVWSSNPIITEVEERFKRAGFTFNKFSETKVDADQGSGKWMVNIQEDINWKEPTDDGPEIPHW